MDSQTGKEGTRLPKWARDMRRKSMAYEMYGRSGRTDYGKSLPDLAPVSMDPEAMQAVLNQVILREHRKNLESQKEEALTPKAQVSLPMPPQPM